MLDRFHSHRQSAVLGVEQLLREQEIKNAAKCIKVDVLRVAVLHSITKIMKLTRHPNKHSPIKKARSTSNCVLDQLVLLCQTKVHELLEMGKHYLVKSFEITHHFRHAVIRVRIDQNILRRQITMNIARLMNQFQPIEDVEADVTC